MNRSGWKTTEWEIARALGGKRRLRTMESFSKVATDVFWPKSVRKAMPFLKNLQVEVKKRRKINVHSMFAEAILKYKRSDEDKVVLATRIPATPKTTLKWKRLKTKFVKTTGKKLHRADFINPLVTVDLPFFVELFEAWKIWKREIIDGKRQGRSKETKRFPRKPNHSVKSND